MRIVLKDGTVDCSWEVLNKITTLFEDFPTSDHIPLDVISKNSFIKIIEFAETGRVPDAPVDLWCVTNEQYDYLKELCLDADYLGYTEMYNSICKLIANSFCGKTKDEIELILT